MILAEPTRLTHGKTVHAILSAARQNWLSLRELGHAGIALEHYCWDRLSIGALERETRAWHDAQALPLLPERVTEEEAKLTEWVLVNACALHDAQHAFTWGLWA